MKDCCNGSTVGNDNDKMAIKMKAMTITAGGHNNPPKDDNDDNDDKDHNDEEEQRCFRF